jgi:GTP cyclohydrolase I
VKHILTDHELRSAAALVGFELKQRPELTKCWALSRDALVAAYVVQQYADFDLVENQDEADFYFGFERAGGARWEGLLGKEYMTLLGPFERRRYDCDSFALPWTNTDKKTSATSEELIAAQLEALGEDVKREGLAETPKRVVKAWNEWFGGYKKDPAEVFKTFADGSENYDEMVTVQDIPFYSHCEHHMAPFFGTVTIAYIPGTKIIGLSKLARLVEVFARRLQVQERLTTQIADAMVQYLVPKGVGVTINARHMCMESRGIAEQGHSTTTTALRGVLRTDPSARGEFMRLVK